MPRNQERAACSRRLLLSPARCCPALGGTRRPTCPSNAPARHLPFSRTHTRRAQVAGWLGVEDAQAELEAGAAGDAGAAPPLKPVRAAAV